MAWGPLSGSSSQVITSAGGPAPEYSSGEIGVVDSKTVEITFTEDVTTTTTFAAGVTILVGSVSYTISSTNQDGGNNTVRYVLVAGVDGTEAITWAYSESSGGTNNGGTPLADVSAQAVTNTAFEPGDLSGTIHWWHVRPSSANGVSGSDADAIATWTENAGSVTFDQATAAKKPTLKLASNGINGLGVLRFDGTDDSMGLSVISSTLFATGAKTAWLVIKISVLGPDAAGWASDTMLGDGYWAAINQTTGGVGTYNWDGSEDKVFSSASIDTVYVAEMRHESGTMYASLNGAGEGSTASGSTTSLGNTPNLGGNYVPSVFFDGDIAEIITSNQAESSGDRASMRTVLENIYGV